MSSGNQLSIEEQVALRNAAVSLQGDFEGIFGVETIERFLMSSYEDLGSRARLRKHVVLLAWRFARERLRALARVEGKMDFGVPVVLFLCVHNAGRSQMALGWLSRLAEGRVHGWSGGSDPSSEVNPAVVAAMAEVGVDISGEFPKPWTDEIVRAADVVVTMGCGDACPVFPGKRYLDWELADPSGLSVEEVRPIRDELRRQVAALVEQLTATGAAV